MAAYPSLPDAVAALAPDHGPKVNDHLILRGGVESDPDGRKIAWDELGRMVAAFEGW